MNSSKEVGKDIILRVKGLELLARCRARSPAFKTELPKVSAVASRASGLV